MATAGSVRRSYTGIVESLATLPGAEGRAMLRELGVRFVVSPVKWETGDPSSPFVERATFENRTIYEVRWTPESEAALVDMPTALPPPPGPVPFPSNEEATFTVRWIGDVSAGTVTLRTQPPTADDRQQWAGAAWRLEASASTADWVSRFFEARDVFTTLAASDLSPLLHVRQIDEGSRELTRAYVYDTARRQVRVAPTPGEAMSPDADATPLAAGARDAVSALFYVRTLALREGGELVVPVNDGGRNLTVRVHPEGTETVTTPLGTVEALRLRVVIERRLERRSGVAATLWLSTDARRVPRAAGSLRRIRPGAPGISRLPAVIETQNLGKAYGDGFYALRNLTVTIDKGEFVFLTGASGAGKSTLLKLLLLQERPTEGDVVVAGRNLAAPVAA